MASPSKVLKQSKENNNIIDNKILDNILTIEVREFPLNKEQQLNLYKKMLLVRRFEEKVAQLYGMGLIGGFCHLYIGQEALVVGTIDRIKKGDQTITSYRDHGHLLVLGVEPKFIMAELTGRTHGVSKGKGGSMHMFSNEKKFYGGHGIVGAQVPLGTGIAFANKYRENDNVSLIYYGDGAANQGQVWESYNMAALWKLPALFIIENNKYAMGTSVSRSSADTNFALRGIPFDIPAITVDAMNIYDVVYATNSALEYVRADNGPVILEMKTYRYRGHSMSDPAKYRSKEEVENMRMNYDPIEQMKTKLLKNNIADEMELKNIDKKIKEIISEAAEFAQKDNEPSTDELYTDILV